jgi:hypothetical protein
MNYLPLFLLSVACIASTGCVTQAIVEGPVHETWQWAMPPSKLAVDFQMPETLATVHVERRGDTASIGTATAYARAPGSPRYRTMIQEALEGPLRDDGDVLACYEIEPPFRFTPDSPWEATGIIVCEIDGEKAALVRGPLGWSRARVTSFEHTEPSTGRELVAAGGISLMVVGGLTVDTIWCAGVATVVAGVLWLDAGLPGVCYLVPHKKH